MKKKILPILITMAAGLMLLPVTAGAEETQTRYLWQADDDDKIYWSTTEPSDLTASEGGTVLEESVLLLGTALSYPTYTLPEGSYQMLEDITLGRTLCADKDITLDLNGYVLSLSQDATSGSIINMQKGDLTLKSSDTGSEHKVDTSTDVWELAVSDAMGEDIRIVTGGVLTGGKGMKTMVDSDAIPLGGAVCVLSGDFTMENCSIVGCTAGGGGAVYVKNTVSDSFTFTMTGSNIMGCTASGSGAQSSGGAVYTSASFVMSDSVIEACTSVKRGGGIYVPGTVTLKSGSVIKHCKGAEGGGVYTDAGLQMAAGAVIENCIATESGGGVYLLEGEQKSNTMAGKITGCQAGKGGGLYYNFQNGRELTISGTIEKCTAVNGGGVYLPSIYQLSEKTVILKGGTITGCSANQNGGGVYAEGNTVVGTNTFKLQNGTIEKCTAVNGGGVYLECSLSAKEAPAFIMEDGSIKGCSASQKGGGVYAGNGGSSLNSTVKLNGGSIKGNNAESGGGIYVETSNLNVRGSVEVTDNVSGGTWNDTTGVYEKGEDDGSTDNNIFLSDTYTVSMLMVSSGKIGFSFLDLSEGRTVAQGGNTVSFKHCVFDAGDEWALYEEGGAHKVGKKTVLLKQGEDSIGYVKFADAHNAAKNGDAIQLLADMADAISINEVLTLDLNGKNVSDLTVGESATIIDSEGDGMITTLSVDVTDVMVGDLLAEGYGFQDTDDKWYDGSSRKTSLSNISVKKLPIQGRVTISSVNEGVTYTDINPVTYNYGDSETFTASVTLADGYTLDSATYEWDNGGMSLPDGCTASGSTLSVTFQTVGSYNFCCQVTVGGYTATPAFGGQCEVSKATLTENDTTSGYTAPKAVSGLVYTGSEQVLITAGEFGSAVDISVVSTAPMFHYGLKGEDGKISWLDWNAIKALTAGEHTVYWYIDGGINYEGVGSEEKPMELTVSIGRLELTADMFTFTAPVVLTYDGAAKNAVVTGTETGIGQIMVKYFKDGMETEEAIDAGNYTVKIDVAEGEIYGTVMDLTEAGWRFTVAKGEQSVSVPSGYTVTRGSTDISHWAIAMGIADGSTPGTLTYELDGAVDGVTLSDNSLMVAESVELGTTFTLKVTAAATDNYKESAEKSFVVMVTDIPAAELTSAPAAKKLTYSGEAQELITAGAASGGTLQYSLSTDGMTEETDGYSTSIPKAMNAGVYRVYYKVMADENHQDTVAAYVDVTIGSKSIAGAAVTLGGELTYSGKVQTKEVVSVVVDGRSLTSDDYTISGNTATDAGSYELTITGTGNYNDTVSKPWSIAAEADSGDDGKKDDEETDSGNGGNGGNGDDEETDSGNSGSGGSGDDEETDSGNSGSGGSGDDEETDFGNSGNGDNDNTDEENSGSANSGSTNNGSTGNVGSSTANNGAAEEMGDTTGQWQYDANGWWYRKADSTYPEDIWQKIKGAWYLFGTDGYMKTGWQQDTDGKWYMLDVVNGNMRLGWYQDADGRWYMLDAINGDMKLGWYQDADGKWYYMDKTSGVMRTGWLQDADGKWYYLYADGSCAMNTVTPDGYRVDENGAWIQ